MMMTTPIVTRITNMMRMVLPCWSGGSEVSELKRGGIPLWIVMSGLGFDHGSVRARTEGQAVEEEMT